MNVFEVNKIDVHVPDSKVEIRDRFDQMLTDSKKHIISFINPEMIIEANKNAELKTYLLDTRYNFVDGIGLLEAFNIYYNEFSFSVRDRYPGTDFYEYLPIDKEIRVFLYGAAKANCEDAAKKIPQKYEKVKIAGLFDGYTPIETSLLIEKMNQAEPDILIVCLGCPRQEKWIHDNKEKVNAKIIVGNGGAIDFWSENVKRAPAFFINHKMEWFYRLLQDISRKRIKRQLLLIPFALTILFKKVDIQQIKQENA